MAIVLPAAAQARVTRLLACLAAGQDRVTIDADVHASDIAALTGGLADQYRASPNYYHGRPIAVEEVLAEMALAGVDLALLWQNPAVTPYTADPAQNYDRLLAANTYIARAGEKYPEHFIPSGWTDPKALGVEGALKLTEVLVREFGFLFVKMNPAQNRFPIDSEPVLAVVDRIVSLGAIPAFHFGADTPYTPAAGLERIAARHPAHPVLAVHMGGGGAGYVDTEPLCQEARALGLRRPNLRFIFSAKRDTHIESDLITYQLAGAPFAENLCFGSDAPYGRMTWNFGGARAMLHSLMDGAHHPDPRIRAHPTLFGPADAQRFLGGNFARLVLAGYRHLLAPDPH